ncbi:MAG TPA: DUF3619 family protein [Nitrosospira sp.]|jgi:hypothetical protein|nr:DUF3619 family protein [Nitrosospira sp.]
MNEPQTGKRIAQILDQGLDDISQGTLDRLQAARRASLENYRPAEVMVNVGGVSVRSGHEWHLKSRRFVSLVSLLLALMGIVYWQSLQSDENEDIDIMLLIDDLPVNAYLDNELDTWLEGS